MNLRIVIIPNKEGAKLLESYSKLLNQKFPCLFELDKNRITHVTILHAQFDDKSFDNLTNRLKNIAKSFKKIKVSTKSLSGGLESKTNVWLVFNNDKEILNLRKITTKRTKEYIMNLAAFRKPHVTLTRLESETDLDQAILDLKKSINTKLVFTHIALSETDKFGAATKILASYTLA